MTLPAHETSTGVTGPSTTPDQVAGGAYPTAEELDARQRAKSGPRRPWGPPLAAGVEVEEGPVAPLDPATATDPRP